VPIEDTRKGHGERRLTILGPLDGRLHTAPGDTTHVIRFRKASKKAVKWYGQEKG
jgi:hypothetical protein